MVLSCANFSLKRLVWMKVPSVHPGPPRESRGDTTEPAGLGRRCGQDGDLILHILLEHVKRTIMCVTNGVLRGRALDPGSRHPHRLHAPKGAARRACCCDGGFACDAIHCSCRAALRLQRAGGPPRPDDAPINAARAAIPAAPGAADDNHRFCFFPRALRGPHCR